jgi:hypothetical protein
MASTPAKPKRTGSVALMLFALPFAGVGVGAGVWGARDLIEWQRMGDWTAVPAQLVSVELEEHDGDDSTTYETTATYRYEYAGQELVGTRVAIGTGADNIGSFQRDLYWQLRTAQGNGSPVTAYVDPQNPAAAVLNRELRYGMLLFKTVFLLLFGGVGFGLLFGARYGGKKLAAVEILQEQFPNEPWRWRPEWASGRIPGSTRTMAYLAIGFALVWNLISIPLAVFIPAEVAGGNWVAAIGLLFPLIGIGLAAWATLSWLRLKRFKVATFVLQRTPAALGSRLKGSIRVDAEVPITTDFKLELTCVEERVTGSGKNRSRSERLLWQKEWRVPRHQCQIGSTLTSIPVDVAVPADQPAASPTDDTPKIEWRLDVTGECPGPDFWSRFELPVFGIAQPAATGEREAADGAPARVPDVARPDATTLAALGIHYERLPHGGEAWTFRRAQHKGVALGVSAFALVSVAATAALFMSDAPVFLPVIVMLFDAIFVYWALSLWLTEYRVTLDRGLLTIARRGLMAGAPVEIPAQWLRGVRAKRSMQVGNKLYYDLRVETNDRTHTAASSLASYDVASWLARYWMAAKSQAPARGA